MKEMEYNNKNNPKVTVNRVQDINVEKNIGQQVFNILETAIDVLILIVKILYSILESLYRIIVPIEPKSIRGEIVLITGTGHGIGRELAYLYASEGATVIGWDINNKGNEETIREIHDRGYKKAYSYVCDISNRENVFETAKKVQKDVGDVTILINNAGIMPTRPLLEQTPKEIEKTIEINVLAHFWTIQAFLPTMKKHNKGHIVALSSCAGLFGLENLVPYCGSKFAVRGVMESLQQEIRNDNLNIKFTTIYPYMVDTGLCKKPRIRFPSIMALLRPEYVAETIMNAQRMNKEEESIPQYVIKLNNFTKLLPLKSITYIREFINAGVDSVDD